MAHPLSEFCFSSNKPGLPVNSFEENLIDIYQEVKKPTEEETTTEETEKTEAESTTNDEKTEETTNGDATHDEKDGTEKEKVQDEETLKRKEAPSEPVSESKKRFHLCEFCPYQYFLVWLGFWPRRDSGQIYSLVQLCIK